MADLPSDDLVSPHIRDILLLTTQGVQVNNYAKKYKQAQSKEDIPREVLLEMSQHLPCITAVLLGVRGTAEVAAVPPATIMLFVDGGALKVCISPKGGEFVAFVTLASDEDFLHSLDDAIENDKLNWRPRKHKYNW